MIQSVESVLFNSDSLFKIASYLPADSLLNLALTCRRFGVDVAPISDGDGDSLSLVEETARGLVNDIATEEQKNALPCYDGDNWICKYDYLQLLRAPLTFDQLVGPIEYVEGNKSSVVTNHDRPSLWATAFSNNIMMAGKHYVSFQMNQDTDVLLGVMRPGEAMQMAQGSPLMPSFSNHFTQRQGSVQHNNSVNCCMYYSHDGECLSHDWGEGYSDSQQWDGMEALSGSFEIGMLLDLDEGALSVYKNDRKLGVMKRGLAGHYCWFVAMSPGAQISVKRGTVPEI